MDLAITLQDPTIKSQAEQQGVPRKNTLANTMASRLRDIMWMNPPDYTLSKISENLQEECRVAMFHDSMDLSWLIVQVQHMENSQKKRGIHDTRSPKPHDQAGPRNGGNMNNFGVCEQPIFKKRQ